MFVSPLWWYHQNIPTSEMLYLFLLLGGAADWLDSRDARRLPWGAWAACFLLVVNHLNAAVLVAGILALATLLEAASDAPLPRRTRLLRTGVAIVGEEVNETFTSVTKVEFYELTDEEIDWYVSTNEPMDKAGAYGIQGFGCRLVKRIEGDYFTVMGLPIAEVVRRIEKIRG